MNKQKSTIPKYAKRVFRGVIFEVYRWRQKLFDGSYATFEKLKRSDTVSIVPIADDGKIVVTEESQPTRKSFIGVPGGRIDPGEKPLQAAQRELFEETGCTARKFILWKITQPYGTILWHVYTYVAKGCKKIAKPSLDSGEKIKPRRVTLNDFMRVALEETFRSREITMQVLRAKIDPKKMRRLKKLLSP